MEVQTIRIPHSNVPIFLRNEGWKDLIIREATINKTITTEEAVRLLSSGFKLEGEEHARPTM